MRFSRHRTRHLLVAASVVVAVCLGWAAPAMAQEGDSGPELDKEAKECIEILEDGGTVDECHEAPSIILPETNEIVWGLLSFAVLFGVLAKFAFPALKEGLEGRSSRIAADLNRAEEAKAEAEATLSEYRGRLADARAEGARLIEEARQAADQLRAAQQARLDEELAAARAQAQADIAVAKSQAMAELHSEVAEIAFGAAESVVGANLDRAAQNQLIEDYINRVANA